MIERVWSVKLSEYQKPVEVIAEYYSLEEGHLLFWNSESQIVVIFAIGKWDIAEVIKEEGLNASNDG